MQSFFKKKNPSYIFPFIKVSFLGFLVQNIAFQAKLPRDCAFKAIQYGYEISKLF